MQTIMVNVKKVVDPNNYRKAMDKQAMDELVASIQAKGILQPLLVRKKNGKYEVVAGRRRLKAALAAKLKDVPIIVKDASDAEALELSIIENSQREDPNLIDEAEGFRRLIDVGKHTAKTLVDKTGKSMKYVATRLRLAALPKDIQKKIRTKMEAGEIGVGHALLVTRLKNQANMNDFIERLDDEMTVKSAQWKLDEYSTKMSSVPFDISQCETCPARTKNQAQLFPEVKGNDECMDESCFKGKSFDFYKTHYAKFENEGFKVLRDEKEIKKMLSGKNAFEIDPEGWDKPKKYKIMCKKCKEHHVYFLIIAKDNHGEKTALRGEICLNRKCYNKMNGYAQAADSGNGSRLVRDNSHMKRVHTNAVRDRFLHAELPSKVKASTVVTRRLAIFHILRHLDHIDGFEELLQENCTELKKGLYQAILSIPEKKLMDVLTKAVLLNIPNTGSNVLLQAAPEAGMDVHRDFKMDEAFLKSKTKAELMDMAKSLKFKGPEASMKKTGMIVAIMENDLTGKITPEVKESFKVELDDDIN